VLPPLGALRLGLTTLEARIPSAVASFGETICPHLDTRLALANSCVQRRQNVTEVTLDLSIIATNLSTRQIADWECDLSKGG
jgi:hypothetical protein